MSGPFTAAARKDIRALMPVWAAAALTIAADPVLRRAAPGLHASLPVGVFAYVVGALALGAHAIGHEYTSRTLATLLVQPWKRSSMLLGKASVLAVMLASLALIAWPMLFHTVGRVFSPRYPTLLLPLIGGLCVAPYVTMRSRSQIAGIVFTAAIPGVTYLGALLAGVSVYGTGSDAAEKVASAVWPPAMLVFSAAGAVLSARAFMRLQDVEVWREELGLPRWLRVVDRRPVRPPTWMLVKKELRLQQMTYALVLLYAAIWTALTIAGRLNSEFARDFPIRAVGVLYFAILPLVMGSIASAQERQLGTLEAQAMLPVPVAQQWAVKAGVVLVLAVVLGVALPWAVFAPPQGASGAVWPLATAVLLLTAWALYLSSCSGSAIIALALVLPATAAVILMFRWIDDLVWTAFRGQTAIRVGLVHLSSGPANVLTTATVATVILVLLHFAGANHRRLDRQARTLAVQAAWILILVAMTDIVTVAFLS